MSEIAIRETAAPWYIQQAEFDGVTLVLVERKHELRCRALRPRTPDAGQNYHVAWTTVYRICPSCGFRHGVPPEVPIELGYLGDSLEEAKAAYAELEAKLLAGELR